MLSSMLALENIDFEFLLTIASIRAALLLSEQFCYCLAAVAGLVNRVDLLWRKRGLVCDRNS